MDSENEVETPARKLVSPDAWQWTSPNADLFPQHRPESHVCGDGAWHQELGGLELDTGKCNYFSLSQAMVDDVLAGDRLELLLWWQPLVSTKAATGHIAIAVGDMILWEEYVPIPSAADVRDIEFFASRDILAGTPITLHLHNHGANTWHFHHFLMYPKSRHSL